MQKYVNIVDLIKSLTKKYQLAEIGVDTTENKHLKRLEVIQLKFASLL